MARRKNFVTSYIGDLVDDTKDFVDDLLDRAKDAESDVRDAVRKQVDDKDEARISTSSSHRLTTADIEAMHAAIADLTASVNRLIVTEAVTAPRAAATTRRAAAARRSPATARTAASRSTGAASRRKATSAA